jgi:hypothetical protein
MNHRSKFDRDYSTAEHALFAQYQDAREPLRPPECADGDRCWVRFGPPCYRKNGPGGRCAGCDGTIKTRFAAAGEA